MTRGIAILDTNIVSYAMQGMPIAFAYSRLLTGYELCISFVTAAELYYGAEKGRWSQRRRLERHGFPAHARAASDHCRSK